ncbi:TIGR02679 family protein [Rossellomorea vietnamensis]|uniref:TIGR02679 family protein n=1 Tax=Rossellomorea vietnamensis TaxID=218284 RepID=A0A5D4NU27_9BACI|nr:TIGR02679 family protein [Rossellomorea vietnamensis]TYS17805.1 TIGR02679 family protein [Rossellomorea vietnamensis]
MTPSLKIFKEESGFLKLFALFKQKYRSLGRVSGAVKLDGFSDEELLSVAGFMGVSPESLIDKGKVALADFERELALTPFREYSFVELLQEVLGETILTKREEDELTLKEEKKFLSSLAAEAPAAVWWWERLAEKPADSRWIWGLHKQDPIWLQEVLLIVSSALKSLPEKGEFIRLPVFAQKITGNPHSFDTNGVTGKLLLHALYVLSVSRGEWDGRTPQSSGEMNDLLGFHGLLKDDLWSFVTCRGFLAEDEKGIHPAWEGSVARGSVMNVPVRELLGLERIWPASGNEVWIVENSSVASALLDEVKDASIICTHGQLRTAGWLLLDYLVEEGCKLNYSGDLDPEGLMIADRIGLRYRDSVSFWRMDSDSYRKSLSQEDITSRIGKLDSLKCPELASIASALKDEGKAGYQEGLIEDLIRDMRG